MTQVVKTKENEYEFMIKDDRDMHISEYYEHLINGEEGYSWDWFREWEKDLRRW